MSGYFPFSGLNFVFLLSGVKGIGLSGYLISNQFYHLFAKSIDFSMPGHPACQESMEVGPGVGEEFSPFCFQGGK